MSEQTVRIPSEMILLVKDEHNTDRRIVLWHSNDTGVIAMDIGGKWFKITTAPVLTKPLDIHFLPPFPKEERDETICPQCGFESTDITNIGDQFYTRMCLRCYSTWKGSTVQLQLSWE